MLLNGQNEGGVIAKDRESSHPKSLRIPIPKLQNGVNAARSSPSEPRRPSSIARYGDG